MRCSGPAEIMDRMGHWKTGMKFMTRQEERKISVDQGLYRNGRRLDSQCGSAGTKICSHSMLLYFNPMSMADAKKLMAYAEEHWKDVKGTFELLIRWRKRA